MAAMHWVWATTIEGERVPVNLAAVPTMTRTKGADACTILFLGGVTLLPTGVPAYAQTRVVETPEALLTAPVIKVAPNQRGRTKPKAAAKKAARATRTRRQA